MVRRDFKDSTAVVGIGYSSITRHTGPPVISLAATACLNAIRDAGLRPSDVDGLVMYELANDSVPPQAVARALGLNNVTYALALNGGGNLPTFVIQLAAQAVFQGTCRNVLVYRAMAGRSGVRMGRLGSGVASQRVRGEAQWSTTYGLAGPPSGFAFGATRYMGLYGCTSLDFGVIAVNSRSNAVKNPRAIMRQPITIEDHQASRWVSYPYHLLDCCLETDAACALVVSSAAQARDLKHRPVYISAAHFTATPTGDSTITGAVHYRDSLLGDAGVALKDIDVFEPYDNFSNMPIFLLEDMGWCKKGEGFQFIKNGRIALDGEIPISTHGGLMSEGYIHGLNNSAECVQQLRGEAEDLCPGWAEGKHTFDRNVCRQVRDAGVGLAVAVSGGGGIVLRRG